MLTPERIYELLEIKDGEYYWKEREVTCNAIARFNSSLVGKLAGFVNSSGTRLIGIDGKCYKKSDLDYTSKNGYYRRTARGGIIFDSLAYGTDVECYQLWNSLTNKIGKGIYKNVNISDNFKNFDFFQSWCKEQKGYGIIDDNGRPYNLDKDILSNGVKFYHEDICVFVPMHINVLCRSKYGNNKTKGVQYFKERKKPYRAYISKFGKPIGLGYYETEQEAYNVYLKVKREYLDELILLYKDNLDTRVIEVLMTDKWL